MKPDINILFIFKFHKRRILELYRLNIFIILFLMLSQLFASAQLLTPEEAINVALNNNFGILVARNNTEIAKINNSIGAAGMLPNVAVNATATLANNNVNIEQPNNNKIVKSDGQATAVNTGVTLNWILFDGGKMFLTKRKLYELEKLGDYSYKDTILQTVFNTIIAYYNVVCQKSLYASLNEAIQFNKEQVNILQTSFDAGLVAKTSLLQAKIDLNVYTEGAINQEYQIIAAKRALNQILARNTDNQFDVIDSISFSSLPARNELLQKLDSSNINILSTQKQIQIISLSLKEYNASRLPKISFTAGYNITQNENNASNILYNRTYGPSLGATLSIPIFQAGTINRQTATSRLQLKNAEYNLGKVKLLVNTQLQNALTLYNNLLRLLTIEKENETLAKENIEIAIQRLRLGQTTILEVHQAQESYISSMTRRINFEYNLKIAETKLRQLVAELK
jgi:outer membrane protein